MLKLKLQYFGHLMRRTDSFEKTLMLGKAEGGRRKGRQRMRWLEASATQWTWVWIHSGSWWQTGKPDVLQSMGLQRVGHDWATELSWLRTNGSHQFLISLLIEAEKQCFKSQNRYFRLDIRVISFSDGFDKLCNGLSWEVLKFLFLGALETGYILMYLRQLKHNSIWRCPDGLASGGNGREQWSPFYWGLLTKHFIPLFRAFQNYWFYQTFLYISHRILQQIVSYTVHFYSLAFVLIILWAPFYITKHGFISFLVAKDNSMISM